MQNQSSEKSIYLFSWASLFNQIKYIRLSKIDMFSISRSLNNRYGSTRIGHPMCMKRSCTLSILSLKQLRSLDLYGEHHANTQFACIFHNSILPCSHIIYEYSGHRDTYSEIKSSCAHTSCVTWCVTQFFINIRTIPMFTEKDVLLVAKF